MSYEELLVKVSWADAEIIVGYLGELEKTAKIRARKDIANQLNKLLADDYISLFDANGNTVGISKQELIKRIKRGELNG